jgi:hypothetical protein
VLAVLWCFFGCNASLKLINVLLSCCRRGEYVFGENREFNLSFYKKQSTKVFIIGLLLFLGVLFYAVHTSKMDASLSGDVIPKFVMHLDRLDWFASSENVRCHVVYYKDESDLDIKSCVESIYFYEQNFITNSFKFLNINLFFVSVPDALLAKTNIIDELVNYMRTKNNNSMILFVVHRAEFFKDISGFSFVAR